jgi:hypothetical protein
MERMKKLLVVLLIPLSLGGCLSFHDSPAPKTTVVVPPGSTVTCNGAPGAC